MNAERKPGPMPETRPDFDVNYVLDAVRPTEHRPALRVAAYIRVSTDFLDQENSYLTQERYFRQLITGNPDWKFVGIYSDYGLSGTGTEDRLGFRRLIRHCEEGKIDRILCKSISRFARNTADFSQTMRLLRSCRVTVLFEKEAMDSAEIQNEFILSVLGAFAQEESRSISSNIKESFRMHMSQGHVPNAAIYGYRFTGNWLHTETGYEYREVEVVREQAQVVQTIYEKTAEGQTFSEIARHLNAQGIPAPDSSYQRCRKAHARKGQLDPALDDGWNARQVAQIVRNERYIGDVLAQKTFTPDYLTHKVRQNNGELPQYYIEDHHPAIIERDLYETVQQILQQRRRTPTKRCDRVEKPFHRKLLCGTCGRFYCNAVKKRQSVWYCPTAERHNGVQLCHAVPLPEERLVSVLQEALLASCGLKPQGCYAKTLPASKRRALFCTLALRLETVLNDDTVEQDRSQYKQQQAALEDLLEKDMAELERLESRCTRTPAENAAIAALRKSIPETEKSCTAIAAQLHELEMYWNELEPDYALRTEALQWVRTLPKEKNGPQALLQGFTGKYFRAFVLDVTVFPQGVCRVRWCDDRCTEVVWSKEQGGPCRCTES